MNSKPKPNTKLGCALLAVLIILFTPWQAGWWGVAETCTIIVAISVIVARSHRKEL